MKGAGLFNISNSSSTKAEEMVVMTFLFTLCASDRSKRKGANRSGVYRKNCGDTIKVSFRGHQPSTSANGQLTLNLNQRPKNPEASMRLLSQRLPISEALEVFLAASQFFFFYTQVHYPMMTHCSISENRIVGKCFQRAD